MDGSYMYWIANESGFWPFNDILWDTATLDKDTIAFAVANKKPSSMNGQETTKPPMSFQIKFSS